MSWKKAPFSTSLLFSQRYSIHVNGVYICQCNVVCKNSLAHIIFVAMFTLYKTIKILQFQIQWLKISRSFGVKVVHFTIQELYVVDFLFTTIYLQLNTNVNIFVTECLEGLTERYEDDSILSYSINKWFHLFVFVYFVEVFLSGENFFLFLG